MDASLYGAQLLLAAPTFQAYLATGSEKYSEQQSRKSPENPLWNTYRAKDRWLFLCLENDDEGWSRLCRTVDGLAGDARFATAEKRRQNASALVEALDSALAVRTADEWLAAWRKEGIVASEVRNLKELSEDRQAWENGYFVKTHCEEVQREVVVRGLPIGLSRTPGSVRALGPELGQHTEEILVETLGYTWEQVGELKEQGAIL